MAKTNKPIATKKNSNQQEQSLASRVLPLVLVLLLPACVPFGLYQNAYIAGKDYLNPQPFVLTQAILDSPYAIQLVQYKNAHAVMVLAFVDDGEKLSWVDSDGNGFTTLDGKIITSNGLDNNLEILNPPKLSNIIGTLLSRKSTNVVHTSLYRLSTPPTTYLEMEHSFSIREYKEKTLQRTINQKAVTYSLLEEKLMVPELRWEAKNFYWVDERGSVLKSKQTLAPNLETYFLETLKDFNPNN